MAWMPPPGGAMYPLPTLCGPREGATSMPQVAIIGVDLAKRVFQLHGAAADGSVLFRKTLTRERFLSFLASQPPCVVAMEACATAHGWGREIERVGHTVRLIPPIYVKPFVKRHKNDAADADALRRREERSAAGASHAVSNSRPSRPAANTADQCATRSPCRTRSRGAAGTRAREEVSRRHRERRGGLANCCS